MHRVLRPRRARFRADVLRKPEARGRLPRADEVHFSVEPLGGWHLVGWTVLAISLVVWFRASLLMVHGLG